MDATCAKYKKERKEFTNSIATGLIAGGVSYFILDGAEVQVPFLGLNLPAYATIGVGAMVGDVVGYMIEDKIGEQVPSLPANLGKAFPPLVSASTTGLLLSMTSGMSLMNGLPIIGIVGASSFLGDMFYDKTMGEQASGDVLSA
jgi:hypothetical protein